MKLFDGGKFTIFFLSEYSPNMYLNSKCRYTCLMNGGKCVYTNNALHRGIHKSKYFHPWAIRSSNIIKWTMQIKWIFTFFDSLNRPQTKGKSLVQWRRNHMNWMAIYIFHRAPIDINSHMIACKSIRSFLYSIQNYDYCLHAHWKNHNIEEAWQIYFYASVYLLHILIIIYVHESNELKL